jgi:hypothetical protein
MARTELLIRGVQGDIRAWVSHRDDCPVLRYLEDDAEQRDVATIHRLFLAFAERGMIRNTTKFRMERAPIYVFKAGRVRICCFFLPDAPRPTLVLTHGFTKQSQKMNPREYERAMRIYHDIITEERH